MPKPEALDTSAPTYFNEELTSIWDELIGIIPAGVAGQSDRITIELFCYIVHQVRTEPSINSSAMRLFVSFASRFGLTPVDRQNIEVPAKKVHNAFDSL